MIATKKYLKTHIWKWCNFNKTNIADCVPLILAPCCIVVALVCWPFTFGSCSEHRVVLSLLEKNCWFMFFQRTIPSNARWFFGAPLFGILLKKNLLFYCVHTISGVVPLLFMCDTIFGFGWMCWLLVHVVSKNYLYSCLLLIDRCTFLDNILLLGCCLFVRWPFL